MLSDDQTSNTNLQPGESPNMSSAPMNPFALNRGSLMPATKILPKKLPSKEPESQDALPNGPAKRSKLSKEKVNEIRNRYEQFKHVTVTGTVMETFA